MGISETVSEKRRRGRPRVMPPDVEQAFHQLYPETRSRHGMQNKVYGARAHALLHEDPACRWLFGAQGNGGRAAGESYRSTILQELGRIDDDGQLVVLARALCALSPRPDTKTAITRLRRIRLGKAPPADAISLANAIIGTVNGYTRTHPSCTDEHVREALRVVAAQGVS